MAVPYLYLFRPVPSLFKVQLTMGHVGKSTFMKAKTAAVCAFLGPLFLVRFFRSYKSSARLWPWRFLNTMAAGVQCWWIPTAVYFPFLPPKIRVPKARRCGNHVIASFFFCIRCEAWYATPLLYYNVSVCVTLHVALLCFILPLSRFHPPHFPLPPPFSTCLCFTWSCVPDVKRRHTITANSIPP